MGRSSGATGGQAFDYLIMNESSFFAPFSFNQRPDPLPTVSNLKQTTPLSVKEPSKQTTRLSVEEPKRPDGVHKRSVVSCVIKGETYKSKSAIEVMHKVFQFVIKEDADFPERFLALEHGKKRRYLTQDRRELYPGLSPEFVEKKSIEVAPGWWLATNFSRGVIQEILNKALAVVHPRVRSQIKVNINS